MLVDPGPQRAGVQRSLVAQCPGKRSTALGSIEAADGGVHVGAPTGHAATLVEYHGRMGRVVLGDDSHKIGLRRSLPAAHARAHR